MKHCLKNSIFDLRYGTNIILRNIEQFKICSEYCLTTRDGIDPDSHFYSVQATSNCNYYLTENGVSGRLVQILLNSSGR